MDATCFLKENVFLDYNAGEWVFVYDFPYLATQLPIVEYTVCGYVFERVRARVNAK